LLHSILPEVLDGSVRDAVEKIGGELFTIVHNPKKAAAVSGMALQDSNLRPPGS
jgi:hypothetical protein